MDRPSFDEIYMSFASSLASRSTCSRKHVGCAIVTCDNQRVVAIGYNGGPMGMYNDCISDEPGKCGHLHAEINALVKMSHDSSATKMYVTHAPCPMCSIAIINAGVSEVIYNNKYRDMSGVNLLIEKGLIVRQFGEQEHEEGDQEG